VFWDDFDGEFLPGWSWIRENDALWSLTSEPGHLRIVLEGGQFHRNLLVRAVSSDNFQAMTHVLFHHQATIKSPVSLSTKMTQP
jgi:hypothetical protein